MRAAEGGSSSGVDVVRLDLIVTGDRSKLQMRQIMDAVRRAGFEAGPK